jgi:hypothetical protein
MTNNKRPPLARRPLLVLFEFSLALELVPVDQITQSGGEAPCKDDNLSLIKTDRSEACDHAQSSSSEESCRIAAVALHDKIDEAAYQPHGKQAADDESRHRISKGSPMSCLPSFYDQIGKIMAYKIVFSKKFCAWNCSDSILSVVRFA